MAQTLFSSYFHIVFSTKNRFDFIRPEIEDELFAYMGGIIRNFEGKPVALAAEYQRFTQMVFIPVAILTGYWMYMGLMWAVVGAVSWVGLAYALGPQTGFGIALLVQIGLFIVRYIWKKIQEKPAVAEARTK